jgi:hypothetical protein
MCVCGGGVSVCFHPYEVNKRYLLFLTNYIPVKGLFGRLIDGR